MTNKQKAEKLIEQLKNNETVEVYNQRVRIEAPGLTVRTYIDKIEFTPFLMILTKHERHAKDPEKIWLKRGTKGFKYDLNNYYKSQYEIIIGG
jgi:hypothetical protein